MSDPYAFWRNSLAGNVGDIHADQPQPGRYKMRKFRGGPWLPVAIFIQEGMIKAAVGKEMVDPLSIWTHCADRAVSEADYKHAMANGIWPGDIGHNSGDLSLAEEIADRADQALSWLKSHGITSQIDADMAANYRAAMLDLKKRAEAEHKAEKDPHLKAGRAVDAKYKPLIDKADSTVTALRGAVGVFLAKVEAEENAKRQAAYEAEQAAIKEKWLAEAAERQKKMAVDPIAALTEPQPELPVIPAAPAPVKVSAGGQRGRVTGLKTETTYEVTDHAKALAYFANHADVIDLVKALAKKVGKTGVEIPGVTKKEARVAA